MFLVFLVLGVLLTVQMLESGRLGTLSLRGRNDPGAVFLFLAAVAFVGMLQSWPALFAVLLGFYFITPARSYVRLTWISILLVLGLYLLYRGPDA